MNCTYDITVEFLTLSYCQNKIFDDFSLHMPAQQTTAILGTSGVGKSTLLRFIANLNTGCKKQAGNIKPRRPQIAYMPQKPSLLPWLSVIDNILISKKLCKRRIDKENKSRVKNLLEQVQLPQTHDLYPHELSGGMYQRVALVRTLFENKPVVLLDEPFSALDAITRLQLQDLAVNLFQQKTVLLVTHDPLEALRMADHVYILSGKPATLGKVIMPAGDKPRDIANTQLLTQQAELLKQLQGGDDKYA